MKKYGIKVNRGLIKKLKPHWEKARVAEEIYCELIRRIEADATKQLGIPIELYHCDGLAGIGSYSRTMRLIHVHELEDKK